MSPASIVSDQSFDQWPSAGCLTNRYSDVVSTFRIEFLTELRLMYHCWHSVIYVLNSRMIASHNFGAIIEVRRLATKLLSGCACTMRWSAILINLKLVTVSTCDRRTSEEYWQLRWAGSEEYWECREWKGRGTWRSGNSLAWRKQ